VGGCVSLTLNADEGKDTAGDKKSSAKAKGETPAQNAFSLRRDHDADESVRMECVDLREDLRALAASVTARRGQWVTLDACAQVRVSRGSDIPHRSLLSLSCCDTL
jgi:hypothetical protein